MTSVRRNPFKRKEKVQRTPEGEMSLVEHLKELRVRLIKSVAAIFIGAVLVYIFFNPIFDFLSKPYCDLPGQDDSETGCNFLVTSPLQPFNTRLSLSGYGGLIFATPVILWQLGRFVTPALYPKEKRALVPFMITSVLLLAVGMVLSYLFMPRALDVLVNIAGPNFEPFFAPDAYLGFFTKMILAFGLAFQLPIVLVFLQMVGILQPETLKKNRRIAVLFVVILAAVITPTGDPFVLGVLAVPMYIFYEISILIGGRMTSRRTAL